MYIYITTGSGKGNTTLSAFDNALHHAGVANYNLITLSSVIPEKSTIHIKQIDWNNKDHGHKLYVVMAEQRETKPGASAWAGLGWVTQTNDSGKGLFVEHHGSSEDEVCSLITKTLTDMKQYRRDEYGDIHMHLASAHCIDTPVCAVVIATYMTEGWNE